MAGVANKYLNAILIGAPLEQDTCSPCTLKGEAGLHRDKAPAGSSGTQRTHTAASAHKVHGNDGDKDSGEGKGASCRGSVERGARMAELKRAAGSPSAALHGAWGPLLAQTVQLQDAAAMMTGAAPMV